MRKIIVAMAAVAAAFAMVSCEKEQAGPEPDVAGNDVITAHTERNLSKTSLSGDDAAGYDVLWSEGDRITIGDNIFELTEGAGTTMGTFRGTLPEDGTYSASYNGSADNWPVFWTHPDDRIIGGPMTAPVTISGRKVTEPLNFRNAGGILRLTLRGTATVHEIVVYAGGEYHLRCSGSVSLDDTDGKVFHLPLPAGTYSEPLIQIFTIDGLDIRKQMKTGRQIVIERSQITDVSLGGINSTVPAGILPGEFSVAEGSTVHFSKGNLRYTIDSGTWSFFDRQYDCGPQYYDEGHDKEISLFTWGYNIRKAMDPAGNTGLDDIRTGNLTGTQDWGSQVGTPGTWRTLTRAEWEYLFKTRTNAEKKYGYATVCGVKGLIILPDKFTDPGTNGGYNGFKPQSSASRFTDNIYTGGGSWEAMEHAGAVFLPAAGGRRRSDLAFSSQFGIYWSSTAKDKGQTDKIAYAFAVEFGSYYDNIGSGIINTAGEQNRGNGSSVRLVTGVFTVTFDLNGKSGTAPESIGNLLFGSHIAKPASPTAEGYVFTGWYKDPSCIDPWNFDSSPVTANTTLYAGWTDEMISGKFTVAKGKQVYFSKGNLWADGSNELHFEDNQWDFNESYSRSHVSHFTWAPSVDEAVGTSGFGSYLFCDEGHKVSVNGCNPMFYALTKEEWKYLFRMEYYDENARKMEYYDKPTHSYNINYCGTRGLVIYPDDYNGLTLSEEEEYTEIPEGCVFLPGAGWRDGNTMYPVGNFNGFYWSSSKYNTKPYNLQFVTDNVNISEPGNCNSGMSIRLVANVE